MIYRVTFKETIEHTRDVLVDAVNMTKVCEKIAAERASPNATKVEIISIELDDANQEAQAAVTLGVK